MMKRMSPTMLAFAAVLLCSMSSAVLAQGTTGWRYAGYTYVSDVTGYVNITKDVCDIKAAIGVDNTAALDIFMKGKNSNRSTGKRSFNDWAVANHTGQPAFDAIMAGKPLNYFAKAFEAAVKANNTNLAMRVIDAIRIKYMLHEWDEAVEKTEQGLTSAASGAPHNLDEAWAILAVPSTCGETHEAAAQWLSQALGTDYAGHPLTMLALGRIFSDATYAALTNNTKGLTQSYDEMMAQLVALLSQRTLSDAYTINLIGSCGSKKQQVSQLKAAMEFTLRDLVVPALKAYNISKDTVDRIAKLNANSNYQPVLKALKALVAEVQAPESFLGAPVKAWYKEHASC